MLGAQEKITEAKNLGMNVALASGSPYAWVSGHLERLQILDQFAQICTRDDVKNVKPNPELYLLAAKNLGVSPEHCLAFEDSSNGLRSAKAAGFKCVMVPNRVTVRSDFCGADLIIPSLLDIGLAEILNLI